MPNKSLHCCYLMLVVSTLPTRNRVSRLFLGAYDIFCISEGCYCPSSLTEGLQLTPPNSHGWFALLLVCSGLNAVIKLNLCFSCRAWKTPFLSILCLIPWPHWPIYPGTCTYVQSLFCSTTTHANTPQPVFLCSWLPPPNWNQVLAFSEILNLICFYKYIIPNSIPFAAFTGTSPTINNWQRCIHSF